MRLKGKQLTFVISGLVVIGLAGGWFYWSKNGPVTVEIDYQDADAVALGKNLYAQHCASCHGANLEGQFNWRKRQPNGRLLAPPHDATGHTWHHKDQHLFAITKFGTAAVVGGKYETDMRGYKDILTDREILAVLAYIKSTWPRKIRERHDDIKRRAGR